MVAKALKHIFLTGFMGCGKTTVGRILAAKLGLPFVDLDEMIVRQAEMSVKDIFSAQGEGGFRRLETDVLRTIAAGPNAVVSTGGGAVIADENRAIMHEHGTIINLTAGVDALVQRLSGDSERPLLKEDPSGERIRNMLASRERFYNDADLRLDTTDKSVEAVVGEILQFLK